MSLFATASTRAGSARLAWLELDDGEHQRLVDHELPRRDAEREDDRDAEERRHHDLAGVEAARRRHVHLRVRVVNPVEAPQERDPVVHPVPRIRPPVQHQDRERRREPDRQVELAKEPPAARLSDLGRRHPQPGEHERDEEAVERPQREVANEMAPPLATLAEQLEERVRTLQQQQDHQPDERGARLRGLENVEECGHRQESGIRNQESGIRNRGCAAVALATTPFAIASP